MKPLCIKARSLRSVNNLPTEIEELSISGCTNLENIYYPPMLKKLIIIFYNALSSVEKLV
ncbi:hypothetical protein KFK09_001285 [Dendrobium nobile]|uniref:Uncharacterized protein n=1 Tax=Dendrobium nobile TaxID=94219 RepID=A0A8T3C4Q3_DENNO|nr:hypothetical protein KFK09_001285 [Dendrobium nobile]